MAELSVRERVERLRRTGIAAEPAASKAAAEPGTAGPIEPAPPSGSSAVHEPVSAVASEPAAGGQQRGLAGRLARFAAQPKPSPVRPAAAQPQEHHAASAWDHGQLDPGLAPDPQDEADLAEPEQKRAPAAAPSPAAQAPNLSPGQRARLAQMKRSAAARAEEQRALKQQENARHECAQNELATWDDPSRPASSAFSAEEWLAACEANPGCVVVEMHKPAERGLVAISREKLGAVLSAPFHRSMLVAEPVAKANGMSEAPHIEVHHLDDDLGVFRYVLVMSQQQQQSKEVQRLMLAPGAVLRMNHSQESLAQREPKTQNRLARFAGPRGG